MSKPDEQNDDFVDFAGFVAMMNDDGTGKKGCGTLMTILITVLLLLCALSQCLGR